MLEHFDKLSAAPKRSLKFFSSTSSPVSAALAQSGYRRCHIMSEGHAWLDEEKPVP